MTALATQACVSARHREVTWDDPLVGAALAQQMSGLDYLRALRDDRIPRPPIAALLGMTITTVEPGRATFRQDIGEHLYNPIGSVHGGVFCTALDSAMGCAVHSALPLGQAYTTLELHVNLIKGLRLDTPTVIAEGELVSLGRRVATASGRLLGPDGTLYAHATTTCLVFESPSAAPHAPAAQPETNGYETDGPTDFDLMALIAASADRSVTDQPTATWR